MTSTPTVLIADDDHGVRTVLSQALSRAGYEVRTTGTASSLWDWVVQGDGDLVITDVVMPDENGLDLLPRIKKLRPELRVIVMSAQNTLLTAVKANERGAFDYLPKPFDLQELLAVVKRAFASSRSVPDMPADPEEGEERFPLIGRSAAMQEIYRTLARLMATDLTVMINGESGTGKELVARALHFYGKRRNRPFVAVNMAAIPRELIESELFGHEKGAFTGATARAQGRFEQAEGGTLFLDEIGDMPPEAQTRLLRVLQEGEYTTVGGRMPIRSNVRIVAATHRDLTSLIRQGAFREDLFYRLNVVPLRLPPLRERVDDLPELIQHFLCQAAAEGLPQKSIDSRALDRLKQHRWPGNVRELENMVRRLSALHAEEVIGIDAVEMELATPAGAVAGDGEGAEPGFLAAATAVTGGGDDSEGGLASLIERHLRPYFAAHDDGLPPDGLYDRLLREFERPLIALTLEATRGNQIRAAQVLGVNRNTLRKKIKELDVLFTRGGKG